MKVGLFRMIENARADKDDGQLNNLIISLVERDSYSTVRIAFRKSGFP